MRQLALITVIITLPLWAAAQPICLADDARAPFVDGEVIACGAAGPTLSVIRESAVYIAELGEWQQAVMIRLTQPEDFEAIASGRLLLSGVELIEEPIYEAAPLEGGDFVWGVAPIHHYQDPGDCRALDGLIPDNPTRGLEFGDLVRLDGDGAIVRFEFAARRDLDDIRLILASPDPAPASALTLEMFPAISTPGLSVQVGATDLDRAPDDGRYALDAGPIPIRLRVSDLEVAESCVSAHLAGGELTFTMRIPDPPAEPLSADRADGNGELSPLPARGAIASMRWRAAELSPIDGQGLPLEIEALVGLPPDGCIDDAPTTSVTATVLPAGDPPNGVYRGTATVWDDRDGDGAFDEGEPGDTVDLAVLVGPELEVDPCEVLPEVPDAGLPDAEVPDDGVLDAEAPDAGAPDIGAPDSEVLDQGPADAVAALPDQGQPDAAELDGGPLDGGPLDGQADSEPPDSMSADAAADAGDGDALTDSAPPADASIEDGPSDMAVTDPDGMAVDAQAMGDAGPPAPLAPGDPQGGALTCQASPGESHSPIPVTVLLALLIGLGARRRAWGATAALVLVFGAGPKLAWAQADTRRFTPAPSLSPYLGVDGTDALGGGELGLRLMSVLDQRPLIFARDGERTGDIVGLRLGLDLALALGIIDGLDLGVAVPAVVFQDGRTLDNQADLSRTALGDPAAAIKVRLLDKRHGVGVAARISGVAPFGDPEALAGDDGWRAEGNLALEIPIGYRFDLALNGGYRLRDRADLGGVRVDDELTLGAAMSWRAAESVELVTEFTAATPVDDPFGDAVRTPGTLDLFGRFGISDMWSLVVGGGLGLVQGYGAPMARGVLGLQYAPRLHDYDGDGIADARDLCRTVAGVPAQLGCRPPPVAKVDPRELRRRTDRDEDDVPDTVDMCPTLAEDPDGFRDDDGCPDADNDLDLLADVYDADPLGAEDWDDFEDADGIPDLDNDRDGVADGRDVCPSEPGGADGCPGSITPDSAEGSLARAMGPHAPLVLGQTIHPSEPIIFEFARPELTVEAGPLVDGMARYLEENPELERIEVGVHVDAMGSRRWKHWLSRARAESVVAALVERGIAAERVFPRGYGPEVPVDTNATKAGRFNNRRVELRALQPFEQAQATRAVKPKARSRDRGRLPAPRARWIAPDAVVLRPPAPIIFERRQPTLTAGATPHVRALADQLLANPDWRRVEVGVHTDGLGNGQWKMKLSRQRAAAVVEALVREGVARDRLTPRGYGATRRLRGDDTLEDRASNRRVELQVLGDTVSLAPEDGR